MSASPLKQQASEMDASSTTKTKLLDRCTKCKGDQIHLPHTWCQPGICDTCGYEWTASACKRVIDGRRTWYMYLYIFLTVDCRFVQYTHHVESPTKHKNLNYSPMKSMISV